MIENDPFRPHDFLTQPDRRTARKHQRFCGSYLPRCENPVKTCPVQKPWNMNSIAGWVGAIALGASVGGYPQITFADEFTGQDFLSRSEQDQRAFISTQMVMASSIAARISPEFAACIGEEFFDGTGLSNAGFREITGKITEFDQYHPSSVMVIVIENACGTFN